MMQEYISFLEELFPAISPYTAQRVRGAIGEFSRFGSKASFVTAPPDEDLQQGDVFSKVPFVYIDSEGKGRLAVLGGMLLTNTCDCIRNERLQFAAVTPLGEYSEDPRIQDAVKDNRNYQYLYLPDAKLSDSFVNFGLVTSVSRDAFQRFIQDGKSERVASLNATGYFLFITKLTVFFMRPEDSEVLESRGAV